MIREPKSTLVSPVNPTDSLDRLIGRSAPDQRNNGYFHTLREILQQPETWRVTADQMLQIAGRLRSMVDGVRAVVLTGSGSSEYVGDCVRIVLQKELGVTVQTVGAGSLLTYGIDAVAKERPCLVVSLARSGDSPESAGVIERLLQSDPEMRHLVFTCNAQGELARLYRDDPRVESVLLDERTNDSSLVMTSSFTNLAVAAMALGMLKKMNLYPVLTNELSESCEALVPVCFNRFEPLAGRDFMRAIYLASSVRIGAARESALKMLEMTAGRVMTSYETYLGLRHGPMTAIDSKTLVICYLSSDPTVRLYEADVILEMNAKHLGIAKVIVGGKVPGHLAGEEDIVIECPGYSESGDEYVAILDVVVGQVLAFCRCLKEGLKPDLPSANGVVHRVVQGFALHGMLSGHSTETPAGED
jgi:tagatose-6-phosphate ketose/aldose isomerase